MNLILAGTKIRLESSESLIVQEWQRLFSGSLLPEATDVQFHLQFELIEELPPLPDFNPIFADDSDDGQAGLISVYSINSCRLLIHYHDGALVELPFKNSDVWPTIRGKITPRALAHGRLEDITFTSLAPGLRRRGLYLVHAFAASKNGRALLLIGTTGSGKTTTGLSLLFNGWQLLANDVVLLESQEEGIFALPTPGGVNIRPQTFSHLPQLQRLLPGSILPADSVAFACHDLIQGKWSDPAKVAWLCFPQIQQRPLNTLISQNRSIALARLMEESVDRWDETAVPDHIAFLEKLCRQTAVYDLQLGQDFAKLSDQIEEALL